MYERRYLLQLIDYRVCNPIQSSINFSQLYLPGPFLSPSFSIVSLPLLSSLAIIHIQICPLPPPSQHAPPILSSSLIKLTLPPFALFKAPLIHPPICSALPPIFVSRLGSSGGTVVAKASDAPLCM